MATNCILDDFLDHVLAKRAPGKKIDPLYFPCWTMGLTEEAGEVASQIKKELYHGHPQNDKRLMSECGDVLFYMACILHDRGYKLEDAMRVNIEKLNLRYPNGFTKEESINRKEEK